MNLKVEYETHMEDNWVESLNELKIVTYVQTSWEKNEARGSSSDSEFDVDKLDMVDGVEVHMVEFHIVKSPWSIEHDLYLLASWRDFSNMFFIASL